MTAATWITVFRLGMVPAFAACLIVAGREEPGSESQMFWRGWALACFAAASISDAIDGFIARRFRQESVLGAMLDPLADKLLLGTALLLLTFGPGWDGQRLPWWMLALVIFRDLATIGALAWFRSRKISVAIRPHWTGKVSTCLVMALIVVWLIGIGPEIRPLLVLAAAGSVLASTVVYFAQGLQLTRAANAARS
ncbi:MAG: CDP-alcohol phosphatidyltransferase family protein [Verrucomicrobiia bacterium]